MPGKYRSLRDEVVYRATLDGTTEEVGDVEGPGWFGLVEDFYGRDYIVQENSQGFVSVECFPEHIDIGPDGYFCPVRAAWADILTHVGDFYDQTEGEDDD